MQQYPIIFFLSKMAARFGRFDSDWAFKVAR